MSDSVATNVESLPITRTRMVGVHCLVQVGLFAALTWKWGFFQIADGVYHSITLNDAFFPAFFQSAATIRWTFLLLLAAIATNVVSWNPWLSRVCAWVTTVCLTVMCLHQGSYNDATFTTAWWTSVWALWYVHQMESPDRAGTLQRAAFLSRIIISMVLLGGAVGKWTAEYWSGEVFFDIYFRDRNYWVFNIMRDSFEPETLRWIATWYSRKVIFIESICGFGLWLLPARWAAIVGVVLLSSIAIFSNIYLFSVMFSVIGLAAVGLFVERQR